jgi:hypothetical protein
MLALQQWDRTADGAPAEAVATVRAILTAVRQKKLSAKLAKELVMRVVPPARATVRVTLPKIVDAATHADAQALILAAVTSGRISPSEGRQLSELASRTYDAVKLATRVQQVGLAI